MPNMQDQQNLQGMSARPADVSHDEAQRSGDGGLTETVKHRAQQLGHEVSVRADSAMTSVGDTLSSMASSVRNGAPAINRVAERTAASLESAGGYLREANLQALGRDIEGVVKRHPVPAIVGAAFLGFLLARSLRK